MTLENHTYGPTLSGGAPGKRFCLWVRFIHLHSKTQLGRPDLI